MQPLLFVGIANLAGGGYMVLHSIPVQTRVLNDQLSSNVV